jgi:hypothetical protein
MLVCSISQRARRAAIAADVAEAAAALDLPGTGNVVFATLVDDPASVGDIVDAYSGEIMLEAASAGDSLDAGMVFTVAVDETGFATAIDATSVHDPATLTADVVETASADATQDASGVSLNLPIISASRAGLGAIVAGANGSSKTIIISNAGAVT